MKGESFVVLTGTLTAALVVGLVWYGLSFPAPRGETAAPVPLEVSTTSGQRIITTPGVERWYTNEKLNFSFRLPDGFSAPEIKTKIPGEHGVVVYNDAGDRLLVYANPIAEGTELHPEDIAALLPGVRVAKVQEGMISTVVRGYWFKTDAKEWDGDGVMFWTAYNGYLYQLQTAGKNKDLLEFIVANWYFAPPAPTVRR
jgi:hypothetical protein